MSPTASAPESPPKPPLPVRGQTVTWPIRAQGVDDAGRGVVVAVSPAGGPPSDIWPKDKPEPSARQLTGFRKPREQGYCIVEVQKDGKTVYRTPRLTAPVTVVVEKKKR